MFPSPANSRFSDASANSHASSGTRNQAATSGEAAAATSVRVNEIPRFRANAVSTRGVTPCSCS